MSEILHLTRDYEVSVWTLQDSFITVLGASSARYRGRIQNPKMKLINDGTQEFTFSIPMYLDDGVNRIKNPVWLDVYNASTIMGMRKIKVIFNKGTDVEKVFEFIITKVIKSHENDKPQCDVQCEGLAFHELGKIGYKIEFSTDVVSEENYQWYINGQIDKEPIPTMDYWNYNKLGLSYYPVITNTLPTFDGYKTDYLIWSNVKNKYEYYTWNFDNSSWKYVTDVNKVEDAMNPTKWYYKIDMDWSSFANFAGERESNKIYDEEYIVAWDSNLRPTNADSVITYKEKSRVLDEKDSNIYNLTQKLAETFGVFCRYEYGYDDNYHIISRTVVYYNTGIKDKERKLSFNYPYSSTKISREDDSVDIVTKMYVSAIEDNTTESGLISITNSESNPTHEDYLLNFDYLRDIKTITDEQYDAIKIYEKNIRAKNDEMIPLQNELLVKQDRLPRVEALATIASNAANLDRERRDNSKRLKDALTSGTDVIVVSGGNAKSVLLQTEDNGATYYFKMPEKGVIANTIRIYKTMNSEGPAEEIVNVGQPGKNDEFGNLERYINIPSAALGNSASKIVYITFSYSPKLYYERIENVWKERLAKDEADYAQYHQEYLNVKARIDVLEDALKTKRQEKQQLIKDFERMMGPALREGYWTPDNYNVSVGERYTDYISMKMSNLTIDNTRYNMNIGNSGHTTLLWDTERFEDEQKGFYQLGVQQTNKNYPCLVLTNDQFNFIKTNIVDESSTHPIGILYYDYISTQEQPHEPRYYRSLVIGASVQLSFIYRNSEVKPALLFTGITNFTDAELTHLKSSNSATRFGYLTTTTTESNGKTITSIVVEPAANNSLNITTNQWLPDNEAAVLVYPRCKIDSLSLKNNETDLNVSYDSHLLSEFEDYYVFQRVDNATESNYYITFQPKTIFKYGYISNSNPCRVAINFVLSNASTAVYLDAREILKENSKPKVTYSVDPSVFYDDFIYTAYNSLNTIAFINDYELEFNWAQGYISQVELDLDFPNEDKLEIKNYKNKFEDLFSTIVAQTEAMEKNEGVFSSIGKVIGMDGSILGSALQGALKKVDLNYAFNNGRLTISEKDGIWGISDDGVVAFRGGGIFTSNRKDANGNWIWNTGIVPQGINADLITAGQLDTNKVMVYAGDRLRFQLNGDGLFAYKSFLSDFDISSSNSGYNSMMNNRTNDIDYGQYVVMNEDGLFLKAARNSYVLNQAGNDYIKLSGDVVRVELSWQGLKMRNWQNNLTFFASADTGDLFISGTLNADNIYIQDGTNWNRGVRGITLVDWYEIQMKISQSLADIFEEAGTILSDGIQAVANTHTLTEENATILTEFLNKAKDLNPTVFTTAARPSTFKPGDIWEPASGTYAGNKYIAISYSSKATAGNGENNNTHVYDNPLGGWNRVSDGSLASITGAGMNIDTEGGTLDLYAGSKISLKAKSQLDLAAGDIQITGNNSINIGSKWINIGSANGGINIVSTNIDNNTTTDSTTGKVNTSGVVSKIQLDRSGIVMHSNKIELMAADSDTAAAFSLDPAHGIWLGSNQEVRLFSGTATLPSSGSSGTNILLTPTKLHLGISNGTTGSAAVLTADQILFAVGSIVDSNSTTKLTETTSISGVQIQKEYIGLATGTAASGTNNYRSLVSIKPTQILIGVAKGAATSESSFGNGSNLNGAYIKISNSSTPSFEIGSSGQFIVRTPTFFIDNSATGNNAIFALRQINGNNSTDLLTFSQNGGLTVTGVINATELKIGNQRSEDYVNSLIGTGLDGYASYADFDVGQQNITGAARIPACISGKVWDTLGNGSYLHINSYGISIGSTNAQNQFSSAIDISSNKLHITSTGSIQIDTGNLQVDSSGNVSITGSITASSGTIGGMLICDDFGGWIGNIRSDPEADTNRWWSQYGMGAQITTWVAGVENYTFPVFWAGANARDHGPDNAPFRVFDDGSLYARDGNIAGWSIQPNAFQGSGTTNDTVFLGKKTTNSVDWVMYAGVVPPSLKAVMIQKMQYGLAIGRHIGLHLE